MYRVQITERDRSRNMAQIAAQLATLSRRIPDDEQRAAARALGMEWMLPDPECEIELVRE